MKDQVWRENSNENNEGSLMNFGGLSDGRSGALQYGNTAMTAGGITPPSLLSHRSPKPSFISSGLSLGLQQPNVEGQMDHMNQIITVGGGSDGDSAKRNREDDNDSRSGSDNLEAISGDDLDQENSRKKKRYHRHTPQQIQELEALFKECPHPDEKQRMELSRRLCLESRQVKFWFQNRRTQMKTQIERHENSILRQENDKLRAENMAIREAMRNPVCNSCGAPAMIGEISVEEQHLRIENARLKEELERVCALAGKFLGKSISSISTVLPNSVLDLGVGNNGYGGFTSMAPTISALPDLLPAYNNPLGSITAPLGKNMDPLMGGERSMLLELALAAMEELVAMSQMDEPLWIPSSDGGADSLNYEQYHQTFRCITGLSPVGYVSEASRETGMVIINSLALVETLMDANRWADMFPCIIAKASTTEIISSGVGGTRDGALQLMQAELQVLSPLVAARQVSFLRFCKQHAEGIWAVVDVSIDGIRDSLSPASSRRLPSGCVVQDMPNGYSKVTWVEHAEYDEGRMHQLYRSLVRSGMAFGAGRWLATLQRQCESLAILMSTSIQPSDETGATITASGRRSMLKLAQRMTKAFCAGVSESSAKGWTKLGSEHISKDVRVMTRKSVNEPGEPAGVVLSTATSVWMPVAPKTLFDFLREATFRSKWDILSNGGPMYQMDQIIKGQDAGNSVSLIRATSVNSNQSSMLILQETCTDAYGAMVVYAPVDVPAMHLVMNGGDSAYVAVLPSGFAISPDGSGSLLTVGFQILVNNHPSSTLTVESVDTVNGLISCTVQKIKSALNGED
ncbi:homeobox-leucine zipper protein ROC5-like [Canna indica]|uniref:Homeobox-leucine zipper protein ROC5-like n=1 Tax=Canna indica TaxID=4628 RepID=A0AAQ3JVP6_9LILI|nr:homeobox-leucine zipper protein ROC5-like [Canna indica]